MQKPSIPKGTRDFGPNKMLKRHFILKTIKEVFEKFGYQPLETPAMENLSVLTGKYGFEGDQLLYKILNSGDFLSKSSERDFQDGSKTILPKISEKGLRYDLTVPFARYVVMNQHEISFPFKRYQIQPVWRADRPQKGRYREFYQCDADVVGTSSMICEAEFILMINEVMQKLGLKYYVIKINNRKLLTAIVEKIGQQGNESAFCTAIDKLDKIGRIKVEEEWRNAGISDQSIDDLDPIFSIAGSTDERLAKIEQLVGNTNVGLQGVDEIRLILEYLNAFGLEKNHVELDLTLARGLNYYTGIILEVTVSNSSIRSSITGGGRYDDLTGVFGLRGVSGAGFSFGVDRIYDVMEDLNLFPKEFEASTKVLLLNFDQTSFKESLKVLTELRSNGIKSEIYPDAVKIKKQMNYANKKEVPFVLMIGENEIKTGKYLLKNMKTGKQQSLQLKELIADLLS